MLNRLDIALGRILAAWSDVVRRRAPIVLLSIVGVTVGVGLYAREHLAINADLVAMVSPDLPFRRLEQQFFASFPVFRDPLLVVIDGATPDLAQDAAEDLRAGLERAPDRFHQVFLAGGGPFFEQHGLLYLDVEELEELADHLAQVQPYVAELSRDTSLRGFLSLLTEALGPPEGTRDATVEIDTVLDHVAAAIGANLEGRTVHLPWTEVLLGRDSDLGSRRRLLVLDPVLDYADIQPAREAIRTIREIASELGLDREGIAVRITGDAALNFEEMEQIGDQARTAGMISFVLVATVLLAGLRSPHLVVSILVTLAAGLVWTAGFASVAVGHLNPVSVSFTVLFIGLGVDFGIHLGVRYRERLSLGSPPDRALRDAARRVGSSLVLCAGTTAIGFYSFVPTDYRGVAELGLISGTGMFVSLFLTLTLLPALLTLGRASPSGPPSPLGTLGARIGHLPVRHAVPIRVAAAGLGAGAALLALDLRFENNPLTLRDPATESVSALQDLLAEGNAAPWNLNVLVPDPDSARAMAERLRALPAVEETVSLLDLVPEDQEEKLAILEDVLLFMGPAAGAAPRPPPTAAEQRAALRGFAEAVMAAPATDPPPASPDTLRRLAEGMNALLARLERDVEPDARVARLETSLLGSLPERLRRLDASLTAERFGIGDLPASLVDYMVGTDGRLRVEVVPREDLNGDEALERFVASVHSVAPEAIGGAVIILESARAVVRSLQQALALAFVAIALVLILLWRRLLDAALVLAPLLLAGLLTAAASVLLDVHLNFADVIVIPLLLGIGVDSGIHLVHRYRHPASHGENLLGTSTARAVLFSALTTMASFGSLALSDHPGMASLGQLLTIGIALTLVCNLVVLPALVPAPRAPATGDAERPG